MSPTFILACVSLAIFFLLVGGSFYVFCLRGQKMFENFKSVLRLKASRSDLIYSLISIVIFVLSYCFTYELYEKGHTLIYSDYLEFSLFQFLITFAVLIFGYDVYFYWTHRLLHIPWLYKNIHRVHHKSRNPTPLSAFAFHPVEAIIQALYLPLMTFIVPFHVSFLVIAPTFIMILSIIGHLGFEFLSEKFRTEQLGRFFGSSHHHHTHHLYPNTNFGFLFILWDQLLRTKKL